MPKTLLLFQLILVLVTNKSFTQELKLAAIEDSPIQDVGIIVIKELYRTLGYTTTIYKLPAKRALEYVNSGKLDGEVLRVAGYSASTPNAIKVPTPFYHVDTQAFIRKENDIVIDTKADLKNKIIVKLRGHIHSDKLISGIKYWEKFDVNTHEQLVNFLYLKRADVGLMSNLDGRATLTSMKLQNEIVPIGPLLQISPLYTYLNKKHSALSLQLDKIIRELIGSGEMNKKLKEAEFKVLSLIE